MSPDLIKKVAIALPVLIFSLCVREYVRARVATRLGDATPERDGRVTLSPAAHFDPIGMVVFPLALLFFSGGIFGWAKHVNINPASFSRKFTMRQGRIIVALSGPLSTLLLAIVAVIALRLLFAAGVSPLAPTGGAKMGLEVLVQLFSLNILLTVFHLIPLPPLDGAELLPPSLDGMKQTLEQYSFLVFIGIFFIPIPGLGHSLGGFLMSPFIHMLQGLLLPIAFA